MSPSFGLFAIAIPIIIIIIVIIIIIIIIIIVVVIEKEALVCVCGASTRVLKKVSSRISELRQGGGAAVLSRDRFCSFVGYKVILLCMSIHGTSINYGAATVFS